MVYLKQTQRLLRELRIVLLARGNGLICITPLIIFKATGLSSNTFLWNSSKGAWIASLQEGQGDQSYFILVIE